jgi:PAS domain S-box-containing protein
MGILAKLLPKALKRWLLASLEEGDRDGISRRAATSLQESEARFSRLFEQSPIPMCFGSDSDGFATTQWNQAWFSSFGFDPVRDQGKSGLLLDVWVNPQDRTGVIEKSLRGEAVNDVEVRMRTATGALRWISLSSRVLAESTRTLVLFTSSTSLIVKIPNWLFLRANAGSTILRMLRGTGSGKQMCRGALSGCPTPLKP